MNGPLAELTIVEANAGVAVRYCGRLFAALGAQVFILGDRDDTSLGYAGACGQAYGAWLDAGKIPVGRASLSAKMETSGRRADLVLSGQDAAGVAVGGALARDLGAVHAAISWFDLEGPYSDWRGADEIILAMTGVAFPFGDPAGPPMLAQGHAPQITAGSVAFNACLAAMFFDREARPARIDVNVLDAAMCYSETAAVSAFREDAAAPTRLGVNRFVPTYPCSPYQASDGWVGVTCLTPAQWGALCRLIGREDLSADPRFATAYQRLMISDEVDAVLAAAFPSRTQAEWIELAIPNRIPITPMARPGELPQVSHWRQRAAFAEYGIADVLGPALPYCLRFDRRPSARCRPSAPDAPLSGLRVADFSMGWAGPLCARILGDLGADVIKIEAEDRPDWWRGWEAGAVDVSTRETPLNFINVNRNKRGVDFDLTTPDGKARAAALVASADVVVENYAAGVLERLGLGPYAQRKLSPGVISLSMPAFGNGGPLSSLRAYGSTVEQASGLPFVNGEAAWAPSQQHIALGDPIAGIFAAGAVLATLFARHRLGGAYIDLAQVGCLFQLGADAIVAEQVLKAPAPRTGHARRRLALCAVVPCAGSDRWLAVAAPDETTLMALARATGGSDADSLARWAEGREPQAAADLLQALGVAAAPVNPSSALPADPQLAERGFFAEMDRAFVGRHFVAATPFRYDGLRPRLRRPAPTLGEHTQEVLAEIADKRPSAVSSLGPS